MGKETFLKITHFGIGRMSMDGHSTPVEMVDMCVGMIHGVANSLGLPPHEFLDLLRQAMRGIDAGGAVGIINMSGLCQREADHGDKSED